MIADDLKYGWRQLIKAPGFAITAILTLGLAIGANTAVFSLVDAVLLKSLPYPNPERLATLMMTITRNGAVVGENDSHTGRVWEAIRDHATTVDAAVLSGLSARISLVLGDRAVVIAPQRVSAGYFRVLGVAPAMGREFTRDEDRVGGAAVTVLSDRLWRSAFNADPAVLGRTVLLKGEPHEVIGIMPPAFRTSVDADLWTPIRPNTNAEGANQNYGIVARLKDGVTWAQASAEVSAVADPALNPRLDYVGNHFLAPLRDALVGDVRLPLLLLSAAVGLVLLVACVNLAGLLLARAGRRSREIATRLAIGGDRRAVIRQLLIESVILAACGGAAGLAIGAATLEGLKASATDLLLTPWGQVALDTRVLSVTLALTALTAVLFGLVPAIQASRLDVQAALAEGGTRSVAGGARGWSRRLLVVAEVALGVVLLVGAGLLIRTFAFLQSRPTGFDPRQVVVATASLDDARYTEHAVIEQLFIRSVERLRAVPGVESAAVSLGLPYQRILNMGARVIGASGDPSDFIFTTATYVTPGYFETLRLPMQRGRTFATSDAKTSAPVAIVNETFARRYFTDREAVGEYLSIGGTPRQIVGVATNVQQRGGFQNFGPIDTLPAIYLPFAQFQTAGLRMVHGWFSTAWIIREARDGAVTDQTLRAAMAEVDSQLALSPLRSVDHLRAESLSRQRVMMLLVAALGGLALFLAAIGIHALIASGVAERTRELGIRMALGATVGQTIRDAALPGIIMAVAGLVIGCVVAYGATGLIRGLLWGVKENDPMTFVAVVAALLAVAITASVVPALRVRKLDPVSLLRAE
ncbi:MAG TPA: ABC transporter permease [Vicinamibacterales bacterium]|nr:ABC transporter permease [Vicinamibacterales bacterium]